MKYHRCIFLFLVFVLVSGFVHAKEPENLHIAKQRVEFYHDSGAYDVDQELVVEQAIDYLQGRVDHNSSLEEPKKLAIVFDIDETSLSNYKSLLELDFAFVADLLVPKLEQAKDPAILPTQKLYNFATENGVTVFFITGRPESLRSATEKNLKDVGYNDWEKLFLKPDAYQMKSIVPYKSGARKSIEEGGYVIVVNIGDQFSDLAGGYSERVYKLPNPYYYIP